MKIEVEKIKEKGLEIEEDIPAHLWGMDSFDVKFVDNIHLDCKFSRIGREIVVDTEVTTHRLIICSRCLEEVSQVATQKFKLNYNAHDCGDYLEIDNDVREEILLNFPMKVLCKPDCKGLCSGCGVNLNYENCQCNKNNLKNQK
jgi:uncharacterized protein